MDANSGRLYELRGEKVPPVGEQLTRERLAKMDEQVAELREAVEREERVVVVSGDVAQRLRLGDRELARRKRRQRGSW